MQQSGGGSWRELRSRRIWIGPPSPPPASSSSSSGTDEEEHADTTSEEGDHQPVPTPAALPDFDPGVARPPSADSSQPPSSHSVSSNDVSSHYSASRSPSPAAPLRRSWSLFACNPVTILTCLAPVTALLALVFFLSPAPSKTPLDFHLYQSLAAWADMIKHTDQFSWHINSLNNFELIHDDIKAAARNFEYAGHTLGWEHDAGNITFNPPLETYNRTRFYGMALFKSVDIIWNPFFVDLVHDTESHLKDPRPGSVSHWRLPKQTDSYWATPKPLPSGWYRHYDSSEMLEHFSDSLLFFANHLNVDSLASSRSRSSIQITLAVILGLHRDHYDAMILSNFNGLIDNIARRHAELQFELANLRTDYRDTVAVLDAAVARSRRRVTVSLENLMGQAAGQAAPDIVAETLDLWRDLTDGLGATASHDGDRGCPDPSIGQCKPGENVSSCACAGSWIFRSLAALDFPQSPSVRCGCWETGNAQRLRQRGVGVGGRGTGASSGSRAPLIRRQLSAMSLWHHCENPYWMYEDSPGSYLYDTWQNLSASGPKPGTLHFPYAILASEIKTTFDRNTTGTNNGSDGLPFYPSVLSDCPPVALPVVLDYFFSRDDHDLRRALAMPMLRKSYYPYNALLNLDEMLHQTVNLERSADRFRVYFGRWFNDTDTKFARIIDALHGTNTSSSSTCGKYSLAEEWAARFKHGGWWARLRCIIGRLGIFGRSESGRPCHCGLQHWCVERKNGPWSVEEGSGFRMGGDCFEWIKDMNGELDDLFNWAFATKGDFPPPRPQG